MKITAQCLTKYSFSNFMVLTPNKFFTIFSRSPSGAFHSSFTASAQISLTTYNFILLRSFTSGNLLITLSRRLKLRYASKNYINGTKAGSNTFYFFPAGFFSPGL